MDFYIGTQKITEIYLGKKLIVAPEDETSGKVIRRDKDGNTTIYLESRDRTITLTDNWIGVLGFMYVRAYLGSAIFSELTWDARHSEDFKALFKRTIAEHMVIHIDNESYMKWDMRELRSELQDYGMAYNVWDLVVPTFVARGSQRQVKSFIKGLYLGYMEQTIRANEAVIPVRSQSLFEDLMKVLERVSEPFIPDYTMQTIALTDLKTVSWVKSQESDFRWT